MMVEYYSVPSDFKKETIDKLSILNNKYKDKKVRETYGQITIGSNFSSGRYISELPNVDMQALEDYVKYSRDRNIGFNYTLNAPFMNNQEFSKDGINKILYFLEKLYSMGIRSLTITLPTMFEIIKRLGLEFDIKASVICQINNVNKALFYKEKGYKRIVIDEGVYRNFNILEGIAKKFGSGVEIIINSLCNQNCANRMFHYNQTSGDAFGNPGISFYAPRCAHSLLKNPEKIMQLAWIRPEDLHYYRKIGIYNFKLQGREYAINGNLAKAVEIYFDEKFDGNLMDLLDLFSSNFKFKYYIENRKLDRFLEKFFYNRSFCQNDCSGCTYCSDFSQASIHKGIEQELQVLADDEQFQKIDSYQHLISAVLTERKKRESKLPEFDFNF